MGLEWLVPHVIHALPDDKVAFPFKMTSSMYAEHGTAQHSTAQHSTAQHSAAQHSTAQHSTAQHSTAQHTAQHMIQKLTAVVVQGWQCLSEDVCWQRGPKHPQPICSSQTGCTLHCLH